MEDNLMDIIDKIIELLEDNNYKAYKFFCNKFRFIDKEHNINFEAKLANNNYFFKDCINNITYIKVRKYIDENTSIQQILKDEGNDKSYYAFIERNNYTSLARVIKVRDNSTLVCTNTEVMNKSFKDILEYANSVFETDKFKPNEADIDKFETYFQKLVDEASEQSKDIFQDYEDAVKNHIEERNEYLNNYIQNDINDDENEEEYEDDLDELEEEGYIERINEFYDKFTLYLGDIEIGGKSKINMIADFEDEIDDICFDSKMLDDEVIDLKAVIEAKMKKEELEK